MFNFLMVSGGESRKPVGAAAAAAADAAAAAAAAGKQEGKLEGGKPVCMCFSRLEVIDLEGLPHGNSQPGAASVLVCSVCVQVRRVHRRDTSNHRPAGFLFCPTLKRKQL